MSLRVLDGIEQGSEQWYDVRRGMLTASVIGQLLTATGRVADNEGSRALTLALTAERITGHTDATWQSTDMMRGHFDEPLARDVYSEHFAEVREVGFMIRDDHGFELGYSPDGLVGDVGLIEVKSRRQKKQLQTVLSDDVPAENMAQLQAGLLVSGRSWCDYISYCGGMHLWRKRVYPDDAWFASIIAAAQAFEANSAEMVAKYQAAVEGLPPTPRFDEEMTF
jgi:predicted phage-related endonuclease